MRKYFFVLILLFTMSELIALSSAVESGYKVFTQEEIKFHVGEMPMISESRPDTDLLPKQNWKSLEEYRNTNIIETTKIWFKIDLSGVLIPFNAIYFNSVKNNLKVFYPTQIFPTKENQAKITNFDVGDVINKQIISLFENKEYAFFHSNDLYFSIEADSQTTLFKMFPILIGSEENIKKYILEQEVKKTHSHYFTFFIGNFMLFAGFISLLIFVLTIKRLNINLLLFAILMASAGLLYWLLSPLSLLFSNFSHTRMLNIICSYHAIWIVFGILMASFLKKKCLLSASFLMLLSLFFTLVFPNYISIIRYVNVSVLTLFNLSVIYQLHKSKLELLSIKSFFTVAAIINIFFLISPLFVPVITTKTMFGPAGIGLVTWIIAFGYYTYKHYNMTINELQLEKIKNLELTESNLEAQLASLKKQLDPHFLFNSLGTLIALIETDKNAAVEYIQDFSDVYRYILETKDNDFVTVGQELTFCNAFLSLLKKRFRNSINTIFSIDDDALTKLVPPLSIQMLLENAMKHNIATEEMPLQIKIYTQENFLVVENNLQIKKHSQMSSKVGLKNLNQRLYLLKKINIVVMENETVFIAKIPLIEKN